MKEFTIRDLILEIKNMIKEEEIATLCSKLTNEKCLK